MWDWISAALLLFVCVYIFTLMKLYCNTKLFLKAINGEVLLYFTHALARCLAKFSTGYRSCPIIISLDIDISLYSDVNLLTNKTCLFLKQQQQQKKTTTKKKKKKQKKKKQDSQVWLFTTMILLWVWLSIPERYRAATLKFHSRHWYFAKQWYKYTAKQKFWKTTVKFNYLSRDMTKPTKWVCAQRRLRSAWAFAQSDQSLRWALNG